MTRFQIAAMLALGCSCTQTQVSTKEIEVKAEVPHRCYVNGLSLLM